MTARAAPRHWPYRDHRTLAQIMAEEAPLAHPVIVGIDLASGPDMSVVAKVESGRITAVAVSAATDQAASSPEPFQRKCRLCGEWRVSRCAYPTCPIPAAGE